MNKKFGFEDVEEVKSRIGVGIEDIQFTGVIDGTNDNGKDYLEVGVISLDGSREHTERFYFSTEKGIKVSLQRIKSILMVTLGEEKAKGNYDVGELNALLAGKKARIVFVSEEYEYGGEIKEKVSFKYSGFIESLDVPKAESKLVFNPSRDIKKMPVPPSQKRDVNSPAPNGLF